MRCGAGLVLCVVVLWGCVSAPRHRDWSSSSPESAPSVLVDDGDIDWLRDTLGAERVHLFERGGHLGNLHERDVQARLVEATADLRAGAEEAVR